MRLRRIVLALNALLLAILACNMPGSSGATQTPDLAATITAQALLLQVAQNTATLPASATAGPSSAELVVTSQTNCRSGPNSAFDLIFTANPGQKFQIVGKNTPNNYWIINNPAGGTCWMWGQNAAITGETASLPEYPAPPAPVKASKTPKPTKQPTATSTTSTGGGTFRPPIFTLIPILPSAPGNLAQSRSCAGGFDGLTPIWLEDVTLTWDPSAGEEGYHVYKNNSSIATLPATATSYHIQLRYDQGTGGALFDNFGVDAYNNNGASQRPSLDVPRCP